MKASRVNVIKLEPSEGMCLRNKITTEVYKSYVYLAKSLDVGDFEEITKEEYRKIIEERNAEVKSL